MTITLNMVRKRIAEVKAYHIKWRYLGTRWQRRQELKRLRGML